MQFEAIRGNSLSILPPAVAAKVAACPIIMQAIESCATDVPSGADNIEYWRTIGPSFEDAKIKRDDRTLEPHVRDLLASVRDRNKSILDVGCGVGRLSDFVWVQGFRNYTGIDVSQDNILAAAIGLKGFQFEVADILDYRPGVVFNAAIVSDVLLYMYPPEQIKALINLQSILNPGAPILVRWAPGNNKIEKKTGDIEGGEIVKGFAFLASEEYIRQIMGISGFSVISITTEAVPINVGTKDERIQPYLIVHAKKG